MKRYSLIGLLTVLVAVTVWAAIIEVPEAPARMTAVVVGTGGGAPSYTEEFYWTCEGASAAARGTGKTAHRVTDVVGTYGTISDCSSGQAHAGTYSLLIGDDDEFITFPITSGNIFSTTGSISMWVYVADDPVGNNSPIYLAEGASYISIKITTTRTAQLYISDQAYDTVDIATAAMSADAWHQIEARWDFATDNWGIRLDGGSWVTSTTALGAFGTAPTVIRFGDPGWGPLGANIYVDDVQIWNTYDQT